MNVQDIQELDIFSELTDHEAEQITAITTKMKVMEGETLSRAGDPADTFYITISGNYMRSYENGRAMTLHEKGFIIGWAIMAPFRYKSTTVSLTDGVVLAIDGSGLLRLVQGDSAFGDKLMGRIHSILSESASLIKGID